MAGPALMSISSVPSLITLTNKWYFLSKNKKKKKKKKENDQKFLKIKGSNEKSGITIKKAGENMITDKIQNQKHQTKKTFYLIKGIITIFVSNNITLKYMHSIMSTKKFTKQ